MCEAKYKDQARRDEILTDMRRTEASLLHASWKASHDVLRHTIRTVTEPVCVGCHQSKTPMTDLLLAKSAERVDAELALGAARCEDERGRCRPRTTNGRRGGRTRSGGTTSASRGPSSGRRGRYCGGEKESSFRYAVAAAEAVGKFLPARVAHADATRRTMI